MVENTFSYKSNVGEIWIVENGTAITKLYFPEEKQPQGIVVQETQLLKRAGEQLVDYLAGKRKTFDLPLAPKGTEFQQHVWKALQEIPYGETRSYGDIAKRIDNPKAYRAVGMSNNKNPLPIFIPCHRVIGTNGKLVGYAGGLAIKEYLLKLEK